MASFGAAIEALKLGQSVKRESWGIQGLHIYVVRNCCVAGKDGALEFRDIIRRSDKSEAESMWVPTQEAVLADDWVRV